MKRLKRVGIAILVLPIALISSPKCQKQHTLLRDIICRSKGYAVFFLCVVDESCGLVKGALSHESAAGCRRQANLHSLLDWRRHPYCSIR